MASIFTYFFIMLALVFGNVAGTQTKAKDTERKSDINAIFTQLEVFYNENAYYPERITSSTSSTLVGLDQAALIDPNGVAINTPGSDYSYTPEECVENNGKCTGFTVEAKLQDGTSYKKESLN